MRSELVRRRAATGFSLRHILILDSCLEVTRTPGSECRQCVNDVIVCMTAVFG